MNQSNEEHMAPRNPEFQQPPREPMFNLPTVVVGLSLVLIGIHLVRVYVLSASTDFLALRLFAFWPVRYLSGFMDSYSWPGETASAIWSFLTYGFLHGSAQHIGFNLLWMAVFGSAVARRFGAPRFLLLSAICAIAGAAAHLATNWGQSIPVIGASAAVSGQMAASLRFIFEAGGPMGSFRRLDTAAYAVPARPLMEALSDRRVFTFILVWFGLNFLFGVWSTPLTGEGVSVAWQAHVGGFFAGLILFPLLDPIKSR
ncbi:Rhomboid protease GlpG [Pseudovibrio axinellae]|uniref:Rhomboid protease GlpG n=1 Tax=Pseudovibrio axinellae TaxID=989403 RepID=A0A166AKU0_9HYPH|nr:rhomboid family intramembrane serine protease [Pseudovibrio axinellae]KZL21248.1 Rhomboid protease GlpG [Pseudovibrio axinellae]SEQ93428.1 Membrane associated serine protease, rhomboid family [Pseudovibrio axinellae]